MGSTFEFEEKKYNNISEIDLFRDGSHFTDDTVLPSLLLTGCYMI